MRAGSVDFQGVETPRPIKTAQKGVEEDDNSQKTSRDGAAQDRVKKKHDGGGQETRTGGTTPNGTGRYWARGRGRQGGVGFDKWQRKDVNQKREPIGVGRGS